MEAGKTVAIDGVVHAQARPDRRDDRLRQRGRHRRAARRDRALRLPDLRLLLRHVHRQLDELPDRGDRPGPARQRLDAGHPRRPQGAVRARPAGSIVDLAKRYYDERRRRRCCRATIATRDAFENAVALDVAMGGSTNTVLHLLAAAREAELDFGVADIDAISRRVPCLSKVAPNTPKYHMEDVHRAGGIPAHPRRARPRRRCCTATCTSVHSPDLDELAGRLGHPQRLGHRRGAGAVPRRARRGAHHRAVLHRPTAGPRWTPTPPTAASATSRTPTPPTAAWRSCFGNLAPDGCVVKTAGVAEEL